VLAAVAPQPLGKAFQQVRAVCRAAGAVRKHLHAGEWARRGPAVVELRMRAFQLVGEVVGAGTGSEERVGEAGLLCICHRTARNRQVLDHTHGTSSSTWFVEVCWTKTYYAFVLDVPSLVHAVSIVLVLNGKSVPEI
jgi:hypothetical protein